MTNAARHATGSSRNALIFFGLAVLVMTVAGGMAAALIVWIGRAQQRDGLVFPPAFLISTLLLLGGSLTLQLAVRSVRQERQRQFQGWLLASLVLASLFMGTQIYGLWSMFPGERRPEDASLGVLPFVFALTTLHAVHFCVAALFVCFVTARTMQVRYDHEYYWGVKVCAWFWHALGVVWLAILAIFTIVI